MQENMGKNKEKKVIRRDSILVVVMSVLLLGISLICWLKSDDVFSESERRVLAKFPDVSMETIIEGKFMQEFESYSLDQFPARDWFRSVKALASYGIFQKMDNNDIYLADGHLAKMEYPMQPKMLDYAASHLEKIYETYLKNNNSKCYFSIVPDKNYFLAKENGYLSIDYEEMVSYMKGKMYFTEYVDIFDLLSIDDYYKTDTHWRQEKVTDVAEYLKNAMLEHEGELSNSVEAEIISSKQEDILNDNYEIKELETPFYGVYYGQAALPVKPDKLYYLNNSVLEGCKVVSYDTGKAVETVIYNMDKANGNDAYEIFLSGTSALQVIENPAAPKERELIVFRDSFGSSLIPLLVDEYSKITVIDTRYVNSLLLGNLVDFHGQDVLFIYSTLILNNSMSMH